MATITYELKQNDRTVYSIDIDIDRGYRPDSSLQDHHANWTLLSNNRCPNCPLSPQQHRYCPAAVDIEQIARQFGDTLSIERSDVWVHTENRSYFKNCDAQTWINSLFGLILASGGCPLLSKLKPLAQIHLPFATLDETIHRLVGTYLINQYLEFRDSAKTPDWELKGIADLYRSLREVNIHLMRRMREASSEDATVNALQTFVSISSLVQMGVDDILTRLPPLLKGEAPPEDPL